MSTPGSGLFPPPWIRRRIRVFAAVAAGLVAVLAVPMWPFEREKHDLTWWWRGPWPGMEHFHPTFAMLLAYAAISMAIYHCIRLRLSANVRNSHRRIMSIAGAHAIALLAISFHWSAIYLKSFNKLFIHRSPCYPFKDLVYALWSSLPVLVLLVLSLLALGRDMRTYFRDFGWLLQIAVIGIAGTFFAVLFLLSMLGLPG